MKRLAHLARATVVVTSVLAAWTAIVRRLVRRHVEHIEESVVYDPVLGMCAEGQPVLLVAPENDTTVVFFDGFRIRPAASMHRHWLERLHVEHGVNVLAPVLGHQSMPFRMRNRDWSYEEETRAAVQLIDTYRAAQDPGHRVVVVAFSFGALSAYALAALGRSDATVLLSPLPHSFDIQVDQTVRSSGVAACALRWLLAQVMAGRGRRLLSWLLPFYVRPGVSGGWDIADPELRRRFNREVLNGQELRIFDVYEIASAVEHVREVLLPRIVDHDITVVWAERDSIIPGAVFEDLVAVLHRNCNRALSIPAPGSGHDLLLDVSAGVAHAAVEQAVARTRASASPVRRRPDELALGSPNIG